MASPLPIMNPKDPEICAQEIADAPFDLQEAIDSFDTEDRIMNIGIRHDFHDIPAEDFTATESIARLIESVHDEDVSAADLSEEIIRGICEDWRKAFRSTLGIEVLDLLHDGIAKAMRKRKIVTLRTIAALNVERISTAQKINELLSRENLGVPLSVIRHEALRELVPLAVNRYCDEHKIRKDGDRALIEILLHRILNVPPDDFKAES